MSRLILALNQTDEEAIKKAELPKQAKEILTYWLKTHGVGQEVKQDELFKDLDSHQEDNQVLSVTPKQPISRIMQFYRKRLSEEGFITVTKSEEPVKAESAEGSTKGKAGKKRRKDAPVDEADAQSASDGVL
jgi:hypothetical protein